MFVFVCGLRTNARCLVGVARWDSPLSTTYRRYLLREEKGGRRVGCAEQAASFRVVHKETWDDSVCEAVIRSLIRESDSSRPVQGAAQHFRAELPVGLWLSTGHHRFTPDTWLCQRVTPAVDHRSVPQAYSERQSRRCGRRVGCEQGRCQLPSRPCKGW